MNLPRGGPNTPLRLKEQAHNDVILSVFSVTSYEPFVELSINEILRLIGARFRRESDEFRKELLGHVSRQLVGDRQRLSSSGWTYHKNLQTHRHDVTF